MKLLALALVLAVAPLVATATSVEIERGPPALVTKRADKHLYDIYVTLPEATDSYAPGEIRIYLRREFPDYMHVRLAQDFPRGGRVHARIAISPEHEASYFVYVYDHREERDLLLFEGSLTGLGAD
ncbi:hypothetical protein LVB77_04465 [Lysobacter sp. 5GHs7-4]|uniref:hypothetical protein n=1 Tax=Lysobacter sp. 5GHs7-4 TaxID=2904253 RepID=UPI001E30E364|nr:hypothetical protein [Lysobacter sp. 5GHs7-4]UHQ23975.1 hypothetical protein LVB77_04465 [Lysobacter sp. 5GHs7-4]